MTKSTHNKAAIWVVSSNRWNSAVTEYALSAAQALQSVGYDVTFSPLENSPAHRRAEDIGLRLHPIRKFSLTDTFAFRSAYQKAKPAATLLLGGAETFLAKFISGPKFRVWAEASRDPQVLNTLKGCLSFSHLSGFIAPAQCIAKSIEPHTKKPVHHVMLGLDPDRFNHTETLGGFLQKRPSMVILGRLDPVKGHERALSFLALAFNRWRDAQRRPSLHIIGQPANLAVADIKAMVERAGLKVDDDVYITDSRVEDIKEVMSRAILGLVPSVGSELICRVGQEFLMCGTPVVVSGIGSLDEILFNAEAGASFKHLDHDHDIATLIMTWVDKSLSEGEVAKRRRAQQAQAAFGLRRMADELESILFRTVNEK